MDFKDNVVILTGASTGIGEAMAYELAGQGAWLALATRNTVRLEEVAAACRARGGRALVVATDVTTSARRRRRGTRSSAVASASTAPHGRSACS